MNNLIWLMRARQWLRHPPSAGRVKLVLAIVAIALGIAALQHLGWWPDWATMERQRGMHVLRP